MILEGEVFLHNFDAFQTYFLKMESKIAELDQNTARNHEDKELKSLKRGLKIHLSWIRKNFNEYMELYLRYFKFCTKFLLSGNTEFCVFTKN